MLGDKRRSSRIDNSRNNSNDVNVQFRFNSHGSSSIPNSFNSRASFNEHENDIMEYVVENRDIRLIPKLRFPLVLNVLIVILWSLSYVSTGVGIGAVLVILLITYVNAWNTVIQETLLVKRTLGLQVQQTNIIGRVKYAKFVPIENIKAIIINEIIKEQRVLSYLLVILESKESTGKIMVPLLIGTLPRLRTIERIYEQLQNIIF